MEFNTRLISGGRGNACVAIRAMCTQVSVKRSLIPLVSSSVSRWVWIVVRQDPPPRGASPSIVDLVASPASTPPSTAEHDYLGSFPAFLNDVRAVVQEELRSALSRAGSLSTGAAAVSPGTNTATSSPPVPGVSGKYGRTGPPNNSL